MTFDINAYLEAEKTLHVAAVNNASNNKTGLAAIELLDELLHAALDYAKAVNGGAVSRVPAPMWPRRTDTTVNAGMAARRAQEFLDAVADETRDVASGSDEIRWSASAAEWAWLAGFLTAMNAIEPPTADGGASWDNPFSPPRDRASERETVPRALDVLWDEATLRVMRQTKGGQ